MQRIINVVSLAEALETTNLVMREEGSEMDAMDFMPGVAFAEGWDAQGWNYHARSVQAMWGGLDNIQMTLRDDPQTWEDSVLRNHLMATGSPRVLHPASASMTADDYDVPSAEDVPSASPTAADYAPMTAPALEEQDDDDELYEC